MKLKRRCVSLAEIKNFNWEDLPKEVVLYNPEKKLRGGGSKIVDYPISEILVDGNGNPVIDNTTGVIKMTGETFEWSLGEDERKKFPKYVAKVLKERYDFLQVEVEKQSVGVADKKEAEVPVCPYCNIPFGTQKVLDTHIREQHSNVEE